MFRPSLALSGPLLAFSAPRGPFAHPLMILLTPIWSVLSVQTKPDQTRLNIHDRPDTAGAECLPDTAGARDSMSTNMVTASAEASSSGAHDTIAWQASDTGNTSRLSRLGRVTRLRQNNRLGQILNLQGGRTPSLSGRKQDEDFVSKPGPVTEAVSHGGSDAIHNPLQACDPLFPGAAGAGAGEPRVDASISMVTLKALHNSALSRASRRSESRTGAHILSDTRAPREVFTLMSSVCRVVLSSTPGQAFRRHGSF